MGCKFSFKRVFFVASLCLAGLFGISSVVINEQVKETPVVERAEAATPSTIYISIDHNCGWNLNNYDTWYNTRIFFYSSNNLSDLKNNPDSNVLSQVRLSPGSKQADDDYYASVSVPSNAKAFIVRNEPTGWFSSDNYVFPQLIPDSSTQLNLFKVDSNDSGSWQKGYWSYYNNSRTNEIYIDRKESSYANNYLALVFYRYGNYLSGNTWNDYEVVGSNSVATANKLSFSSTCYGGVEYSDAYDINTKMASYKYKSITSFDVYYSTNGSSYSASTYKKVFLPLSSTPLLFTMNDGEWSSSIPEKIKLIADASSPQDWYSDINNIYDKSKEGNDSIRATFKNSVGGTDVSVLYLEPITINGKRYGSVTIPFGAEAVNLYGEKAWANCEYSIDVAIPTPSDGRKYVFIKTTTNYRNAETEWVGGSNQLAEFDEDPFRYTITYHGDYGSNATSYVWGVGATLTNPTKTGYTFHGFHYSPTYSDASLTSISKNETGDLDIYANWTPNLHTITWYDEDGETILDVSNNVPYDSMPSYEGRTPTKTGYGFTGWSPEVHTVDGDNSYIAQYAECPAVARVYINYTWGDEISPYVGSSFGPANQPEAIHDDEGISADSSHFIPESADGDNTFVGEWTRVSDVSMPSSGQNTLYCTFFQDGSRWIPWRNGQDRQSTSGFNNAIGQNDSFTTNFNNGYIYYISGIDGSEPYEYGCWDGGKDTWDGNNSRKVKWFKYSISCVGAFVHYNLNGGSFSDSHSVDEEAPFGSLTLPSTPVKSGHTFMGWEASTNGILNRASTSFTISQPMTFTAIWASNTVEVVGGTGVGDDSNVRVWVGYDNNGTGVGSLIYNGFGYEPKIWVHQGNGTAGDYELILSPKGTIYNTNENAASDLANCPRRYDYYDVPLKYFTNNCYLNIKRFNPSSTCEYTTPQIQLSSSDNYAFKVIYAQSAWDWAPVVSDITSNKSSALLAAYGLSGLKTCSSNLMNGYGGYARWYNTFAQENSSIVEGLSDYTIVDYINLSDYSSESSIGKQTNAASKYEWTKWMYDGKVGPMPSPGLGYVNGSVSYMEQENTPIVIIVIVSSVSLLSITALSVLVIKKRKSKEQ